jgi:dihydroorotate dehydrogenase (NAD+) catalytic subunit
MSTRVAGLTLASPVLVASGCGGTGRELSAYAPLSTYGAFTTRSISRDARPGAGGATLAETPAGLVHATGLPNPGLDVFLATELPWLLTEGARVVVSIVARDLGEYAEVARRLATAPGVSAVEVNLAVPDAAELGVLDAREPFHVGAAVSTVLRELPRGVPVLAKLRLDPVRVAESVKVAAEAGAGAVVLRCVTDARAALDAAGAECDVVACGGIGTAEDARTALRLGAVAVQVGSALFHDPTTAARLAAALDPDEGA